MNVQNMTSAPPSFQTERSAAILPDMALTQEQQGKALSALRKLHDMTQDEVAALGGAPNERSQVARAEKGQSKFRSHPLREMLSAGLGLTLEQFGRLLSGDLAPEEAARQAAADFAPRLRSLRERAAASPEGLEEAIRAVAARRNLLESAIHFCREWARDGRALTQDGWEAELLRIDSEFRQKMRDSGKAFARAERLPPVTK